MIKALIWGTAVRAEKYLKRKNKNVEVQAFIEGNVSKHGQMFENRKIIGLTDIDKYTYDYIVICSGAYEEIMKQLVGVRVPISKIFVAVPLYYWDIHDFWQTGYIKLLSYEGSIQYSKEIMELQTGRFYLAGIDRKEAFALKNSSTINIDHPQTLNEKIKRMEIDKFGKLEMLCADKYNVRKYIEYCGIADTLVPLYFVWDNVDEIDFSKLPSKYILKCTHGCGANIICKDTIDMDWAYDFLLRNMKINFAWLYQEWHYSDIIPKIICEELLEDSRYPRLFDYKYFCCNGEPHCILVCSDRTEDGESKHQYFDLEWNEMPYATENIMVDREIEKPVCLERMNEIARKLAEPFPFVRVDLYEVNGKVYFGELTFTPMGGNIDVQTEEAQLLMGSMIDMDYNKAGREKLYRILIEE